MTDQNHVTKPPINGGWVRYDLTKPPAGKKVICFLNGDMWVGIRLGNHMMCPSAYMRNGIDPDLWMDIKPPDGWTGEIRVMTPSGEFEFLSSFEHSHPKEYNDKFNKIKKPNTFQERKKIALEQIDLEKGTILHGG